MKKLLTLFVFLFLIGISIWYFKDVPNTQPAITNAVKNVTDKVEQTAENQKIGTPVRLIIPKIAVDATVESVGQDAKGRMDVPKQDENVAWYNMGYKPGQNGSAVVAGHLDSRSGAPAVFYNIGKLEPGDEIKVTDDGGNTLTYEVTDSRTYNFDEVPLQEVFATEGKALLNLITCEGTFDRANSNYSKRLVVYSELRQ